MTLPARGPLILQPFHQLRQLGDVGGSGQTPTSSFSWIDDRRRCTATSAAAPADRQLLFKKIAERGNQHQRQAQRSKRLFAFNPAMNFDQRAKPQQCRPECPSVLVAQFLYRPYTAAASMENRNEYPVPARRTKNSVIASSYSTQGCLWLVHHNAPWLMPSGRAARSTGLNRRSPCS